MIVDPMIDDLDFARILNSELSDGPLPDDALFMNAFIPHKLDSIAHFERDHAMEKEGKEMNNPFQKIIGKTLCRKESTNSSGG